ncbi:hypothetical protein GQ53DRAFT_311397 [Thozetella sp. PMI_491]|nr:hypothetical protein GQ53DRAFT_311397 [Thozetella sp. PMI_491]
MASRILLGMTAGVRPGLFIPGSQLLGKRTLVQTRHLGLKESQGHEPNPEATEKHKQDSLSKQKAGKGHWKPELASDSEEGVKADRLQAKGSDAASIKELQERTKRAAEETSKAGTSMRDGL